MLDGMLIPRDTLLSQEKYENIKEDLAKMKKMYNIENTISSFVF